MFNSSILIPWGDTKPETCKVYTNDMLLKSPGGKWFKNPRFVVSEPICLQHNAVMTAGEFRGFPWNHPGMRAIPTVYDSNRVVIVWESRQPLELNSGRVCSAIQLFAEGSGDSPVDSRLRAEGFCF